MPAIWEECDAVEELTNTWADQRDEVYDLIEAYQELTREIQAAMQAAAMAESRSNTTTSAPPSTTNSNQGTPSGDSSSEAAALAAEAQEIVTKVHNGQIKQTNAGWKPSARSAGYSDEAISIAQKAFNDSKAGGGYSYYYDEALKLAGSYDTGGYTGEWGPEGRLAILHQKELVLNANQTEKFFNLANKLTDISSKIDQNAISSTQGLSSLLSQMLINSGGQTLEQRVHIEASFPNVSDKTQIEEAFGNLINLASQYANRKF